MRKRVLLGILVFFIYRATSAYPPYIMFPSKSAVSTTGEITFQCDGSNAEEGGTIRGGVVVLKGPDGVVRELSLTRVATSGDYQYTYQATTNVSLSGQTEAYFAFWDDTTRATQSFKNTTEAFPPPANCWARTLTDPTGDLENDITDPKLDITGQWATYSDHRLYFKISHAGGDWNVGGLWPPYYSWVAFVINPEAASDTFYYALLYCKNIPGVIGPGLWRFTRGGSFNQIGAIQQQVVNDSLVLSCSFDTLVADRYFGPWPNTSGYLVVGARTDKAVSLSSTLRADVTPNQKFYPATLIINPSAINHPPVISDYNVSGKKSVFAYTFTINYTDEDNNLPTIHKVIANGSEFDMTAGDHLYSDGAIFRATVNLDMPLASFGFKFFDGRDSSNIVFLSANEPSFHNPEVAPRIAQVYPNPFNSTLCVSFASPVSGSVAFELYDINGKLVDRAVFQNISSGANNYIYTPNCDLPSGLYLYRLSGFSDAGKVLYLK